MQIAKGVQKLLLVVAGPPSHFDIPRLNTGTGTGPGTGHTNTGHTNTGHTNTGHTNLRKRKHPDTATRCVLRCPVFGCACCSAVSLGLCVPSWRRPNVLSTLSFGCVEVNSAMPMPAVCWSPVGSHPPSVYVLMYATLAGVALVAVAVCCVVGWRCRMVG